MQTSWEVFWTVVSPAQKLQNSWRLVHLLWENITLKKSIINRIWVQWYFSCETVKPNSGQTSWKCVPLSFNNFCLAHRFFSHTQIVPSSHWKLVAWWFELCVTFVVSHTGVVLLSCKQVMMLLLLSVCLGWLQSLSFPLLHKEGRWG